MVIKKIVFFVFIIFAIFVINDLAQSIYNLWQKNDLIDQSEQMLAQEKEKNNELKKKLNDVKAPNFVEEEARNKLFMVKPGEGIVVIAPTEYLHNKPTQVKFVEKRPNWQQWWDTFFGS